MADFLRSVSIVIDREVGDGNPLEDDPRDPGGLTKWGIILEELKALGFDTDGDGDVDRDDLRKLGRHQAIEVYKRTWWDPYGYDGITNQGVATKVFDTAVNLGQAQAIRIAQRALRCVGWRVEEDGKLGPQTRNALNQAASPALMAALKSEQAGIYRQIVARNRRMDYALAGWLNRAYS